MRTGCYEKRVMAVAAAVLLMWGQAHATGRCPETLAFDKRELNSSETVNLCEAYLGHVVLIVNTASKCGLRISTRVWRSSTRVIGSAALSCSAFLRTISVGKSRAPRQQIQSFLPFDLFAVTFPMFEKTHAARQRRKPYVPYPRRPGGRVPDMEFPQVSYSTAMVALVTQLLHPDGAAKRRDGRSDRGSSLSRLSDRSNA